MNPSPKFPTAARQLLYLSSHRKRIVGFSVLGFTSVVAGVVVACTPLAPIVPARPVGNTPAATPEPASQSTVRGERAGVVGGRDRVARIALAGGLPSVKISATGPWEIQEQGGRVSLVKGEGREPWQVERKGGLLRITGAGNDATPWREGPFVARTNSSATFVQYAGKRYRGELWFTATDTGVMVVNRVHVEDYLRGVVPLELGTRAEADRSALEAQAIAARSYSYIRVPRGETVPPRKGWHMRATVSNQVYGGVEAEAPVVNSAIDATAGLVIQYGGLLVDAPYSASCGGRSAVPSEAWRDAPDQPYLTSHDDNNPATGRPFCEIAPRADWTATFDESALSDVVMRHLKASGAQAPTPGAIAGIKINDRSTSGRVRSLQVATARGDVTLQANEIRSLFRDARGAILSSTYFSVDRESRERGHLTGVTLRGTGNGHGVGMCQWGAIGRARAGQDYRTILRHYYPGTVVGFVD
ncbi:MAG: SpoIID/LytB domain-containing protein [Phycisphaerae bacterium]|nr:SpoIID/LytB domain-containing protein [Gemmatimonadaceae bacterium]